MEFGDYNASESSNVKKGTVALRTLKKPKVYNFFFCILKCKNIIF